MSEAELKPCPFCGETRVDYWHDFYGEGMMSAVSCRTCDAAMMSLGRENMENYLVEQWNRRVAP